MTASASRGRFWTIFGSITLALLIGALFGSHTISPPGLAKSSLEAAIPPLAPATSDPGSDRLPVSGTFAPVVSKATPAVVSITATRQVRAPGNAPSPFFFGPQGPNFGEPGERRQQGRGSGVIVSAEGYVLTNHHVIDGASEIEVHLADKRDFDAKLVGTDAKTDIAVLKIDAANLPVLPLGNSDNVAVGDIVLAIGNPFSVGQTVTMGIVGATGRGRLGIEDYEDFIQTDAAINPGNSGGALINYKGELIGINTAIVAQGARGNQGIGFAVPVNMAHHVMTQILRNGRVVRGFLGVGIQDVTAPIAEAFNVPKAEGAVVRSVEPGTPAAKAGLAQGDVILKLDDEEIEDSRQLRLRIASEEPGATVRLAVWRNGAEREVPVKLGELPEEPEKVAQSGRGTSALEGLAVDDLSPAVARQLNLPAGTEGVVVVEVRSGSPAAEAGLRRGDVIEEVGRRPVTNVAEFQAAVRKAGKKPVLLLVNRNGSPFFVVVEPR